MALLDNGMLCAICKKPILDVEKDELFCTTFLGIRDIRFVQLDDAAMHQCCIDQWPQRDDFVKYYNASFGDQLVVVNESVVRVQKKQTRLWSKFFRRSEEKNTDNNKRNWMAATRDQRPIGLCQAQIGCERGDSMASIDRINAIAASWIREQPDVSVESWVMSQTRAPVANRAAMAWRHRKAVPQDAEYVGWKWLCT
jgi:hypothetical protein